MYASNVLIVVVICYTDFVISFQKGLLLIPSSYVALSGDLHVQLHLSQIKNNDLNNTQNNESLSLLISQISKNYRKELSTIEVYPDHRHNVTQITVSCKYFVKGGSYELEIVNKDFNKTEKTDSSNWDERLKQRLTVIWPTPKLQITPNVLETYPDEPLTAKVYFPVVNCRISENQIRSLIFRLELVYCGENVCVPGNDTTANVLYSEDIQGYPSSQELLLNCQLFGLAGHYMFTLRHFNSTPLFDSVVEHIKVDWNTKLIFNVHARSIFPCDPHSGVGVFYEYPSCILDQSDRIRLFGKLRADVASLKPPTSLHYISEQKIAKGQHSLYFDCELFSEKFVEYCFAYVTQAISGAVSNIRMDCVHTLPVKVSDTGGWGPWSEWTPCSTSCSGGTRNRYRFCDSPPPRYGAKFCEGPAVETEQCGQNVYQQESWNCTYSDLFGKGNELINKPSVIEEIGPGCRCGCIVHLGLSKPKRLLAASTENCPGKSFWLIQGESEHNIQIKINYLRLPCGTQYIKIRDGDSVSSNLLVGNIQASNQLDSLIVSSGSKILIELFSDKKILGDTICTGGFLAHVNEIPMKGQKNHTLLASFNQIKKMLPENQLTIVHITAVIFAAFLILISSLLGAHYIMRYRNYHIALSKHEPDSSLNTPRTSSASINNPPTRALSTNTLLSEVIYLVKIRPKGRNKHIILRESVDVENMKDHEVNMINHRNDRPEDQTSQTPSALSNTNCDDHYYQQEKETTYSVRDSLSMKSNSIKSNLDENNTNKSPVCSRTDKGDTDYISTKLYPAGISTLSASNITLTNGCYSSAGSVVSIATIRTTNTKESKDLKNRENLLSRPDSIFSLANPEELELDYYDYNVINAGAAPGSYLGMDPAYLVWIPPLDCEITDDEHKTPEPHYEEILPHFNDIDTFSNAETPTPTAPSLPPLNMINECLTMELKKNASLEYNIEVEDRLQTLQKHFKAESLDGSYTEKVDLAEKDTTELSSLSGIQEYYELDDIKFADEESSHNTLMLHHTNIV